VFFKEIGMNRITPADIAAYVESEWERRAAAVPHGMKPASLQLIANKVNGEGVTFQYSAVKPE
jgi:hypothetical protein